LGGPLAIILHSIIEYLFKFRVEPRPFEIFLHHLDLNPVTGPGAAQALEFVAGDKGVIGVIIEIIFKQGAGNDSLAIA